MKEGRKKEERTTDFTDDTDEEKTEGKTHSLCVTA
jgi:hypothetical protein